MSDLSDRLRAALDRAEEIARAASSDRDGSTPGGEHWRWECTTCDQPIPITPVTVLDEHLECPACSYSPVALRSVEEYPTGSVGPLSHFVVRGVEEQRPVDALHIQMHDPARVLRTVAAHRKILDRHGAVPGKRLATGEQVAICQHCYDAMPCGDVAALASIYFPEETTDGT